MFHRIRFWREHKFISIAQTHKTNIEHNTRNERTKKKENKKHLTIANATLKGIHLSHYNHRTFVFSFVCRGFRIRFTTYKWIHFTFICLPFILLATLIAAFWTLWSMKAVKCVADIFVCPRKCTNTFFFRRRFRFWRFNTQTDDTYIGVGDILVVVVVSFGFKALFTIVDDVDICGKEIVEMVKWCPIAWYPSLVRVVGDFFSFLASKNNI